jgi:required for meiotic nuclear division protein 1
LTWIKAAAAVLKADCFMSVTASVPHADRAGSTAPLASLSVVTPAEGFAGLVSVRALLLGERLDTRGLEGAAPLATAPVAVAISGGGIAVLFRYGAAVLFAAPREAADRFLASIARFVTEPLPIPEQEEAQLVVRADADQHVDAAGNIVLREQTIDRLQLVADVLAKSLVLAHYETGIAAIFDRIEPLAATLRKKGRIGARGKELLHHIGNVLATQHKMVGRVETGEKPELLWERPELERLYMRLADEYELRDRDRALGRKLEIISRTVETMLGLVQARSSIRVEWYIVLLIVAELVLAAYSLLPRR